MTRQLSLLADRDAGAFPARTVNPILEFFAHEALWADPKMTVHRMANLFRASPDAWPSDLADPEEIVRVRKWLTDHFEKRGISRFGISINRTADYQSGLREARNPIEVLSYLGSWDWTDTPAVAVVGSRKPSADGVKRCKKLVRCLAEDDFTIVSGLATGIDETAHETALEMGAPTVAVIGTPISEVYPKSHAPLQATIAKKYCVVSQVPTYRYHQHNYLTNRKWFPERNVTMSALTRATVIVEASDTSGTLFQARAAIDQERLLFVLDSCFENPDITWPAKMEAKGAIRVSSYDDIREHIVD